MSCIRIAGGDRAEVGMLRIDETVRDGCAREEDQRDQLNDIDDQTGHRRAVDAAHGDPAADKREHDSDDNLHHQRQTGIAVGVLRAEQPRDIADQDRHKRHHHTGIDPVEQVRGPAGDQFGQSPPFLVRCGCFVGKRLFREVVGASEAGLGIDFSPSPRRRALSKTRRPERKRCPATYPMRSILPWGRLRRPGAER